MEGINDLDTLEKVELYDNQLLRITALESLTSLKVLDISYNSVRDMSPVSCCLNLEELYIGNLPQQ